MTRSNDGCCEHFDQTVAYIYGEIEAGERSRFESHLADCDLCVDEMAALSMSRFSVYEWNRDVFSLMETPKIDIPYDTPELRPIVQAGNGSFFDAIAAFVFRPAFASGIAAALLLAIGGYIWTDQLVGYDRSVAVAEPIKTEIAEIAVIPNDGARWTNTDRESNALSQAVPARFSSATPMRQRTAAERVRSTQRSTRTAERSGYTLAEFQDTDDDSLRLAQMLDELGG